MSTLNQRVTPHRDTDVVSPEDRELALENERVRRENRILKDLSRTRKQSGFEQMSIATGHQSTCEWFSRRMREVSQKAAMFFAAQKP